MKTIITKKIDGIKIIHGIGDAGGLIDPEATRKIVDKKIKETQVWKDIHAIKKQMQVYANQAMQAKKSYKSAKSPEEQRKLSDEWKLRTGQMKELENDLKPLAVELKKAFSEFMETEAVYFENGTDQVITDAEADSIRAVMVEATREGKLVDENLNKVVNNKGKIFWKKDGSDWIKTEIKKIGIDAPKGAIEENNLTDDQKKDIAEWKEKKRILELTSAQKIFEKESAIEAAASQADDMRGKLTIQGTSEKDALSQAQAWYSDRVSEIEKKYA